MNESDNEPSYCSELEAVSDAARYYNYEKAHSDNVRMLAVRIYDQLKELHGFGGKERFILESAAILHDIGWQIAQRKHHKSSMKLIIADESIPFDSETRIAVALVARYHRKSLPKEGHVYYCELNQRQRSRVDKLSAILRIADGLDRTHNGYVSDISCIITENLVTFLCDSASGISPELEAAKQKSDLFVRAFGKNVRFDKTYK